LHAAKIGLGAENGWFPVQKQVWQALFLPLKIVALPLPPQNTGYKIG
jgi:hypothetical protein